jgi:DUF4097 and DUF4098 domain-containing protein YvlB
VKVRAMKAAVLALIVGAAVAACAQNTRVYREGNAWIEESTGSLPQGRSLRVDVAVGSVSVQGGGSNPTYTIRKKAFTSSQEAAKQQFEMFRVSTSSQGDTIVIKADFPRGGNHRMSADFALQVPRDMQLVDVNTRGGSINVQNIAGRVEGETAGGSMNLNQIGGAIVASTMGGSISVGSASGEVNVKSAGGSINVNNVGGRLAATTYGGSMEIGSVQQNATLETMGGSVRVQHTGGDLHATTAGGNIDAGEVGGAADLETAGGNIRLGSARGPVKAETAGGGISLWKVERGVRAETAGGGITAELLGRVITDSQLETAAGDITVILSSNVACNVRAAIDMATGHRIRSDFPEVKITTEGGEYGPKQWFAQGALNGGGPTLKLRTSIGDIEIRRASTKQ